MILSYSNIFVNRNVLELIIEVSMNLKKAGAILKIKFLDMLLSIPSVWNKFDSKMSEDMIKTCRQVINKD